MHLAMTHVEFAVVDDLNSYDMVLGINTVREYDLTRIFRCHFAANHGVVIGPGDFP
jgi:hypothetical protein